MINLYSYFLYSKSKILSVCNYCITFSP